MTSSTVSSECEIRRRLREIEECDAGRYNGWSHFPSSARNAERRRLEAELQALREREAAAQRTARRAAVTAVLAPRPHWRKFVRELAEHAVALALQHGITVRWDGRRPRAHVAARIVWCDVIGTESAYSTFLHELAHVVQPRADAQQQPHSYGESTVISPLAEIAAWRWAVDNCWRRIWTPQMEEDLQSALKTYSTGATLEDREAIGTFMMTSNALVMPAPDTVAGRERHLRHTERERRATYIRAEINALPPKLAARIARARASGIAI